MIARRPSRGCRRLQGDRAHRACTWVPTGGTFRERSSLAELLRRLAEWPDDVLFRVSSLEPMDCTPDVVSLAAASPRIAPHFHLPLQHGADAMLRAMRRPYTAAYYSALVDRIARLMPHASIGSDLIVGFPGETDAQFEESRRGAARSCRCRTCMCFPIPIDLEPRRARLSSESRRRWRSASAPDASVRSAPR